MLRLLKDFYFSLPDVTATLLIGIQRFGSGFHVNNYFIRL